MQRSTWYYRSQVRDQSALRILIRDIAQARPRFGYVRILVMLKREGWNVGKTRIYRLYRLENLQLRMRSRRRKRRSLHRGATPLPTGRHQYWAMDFVHDQLVNGRAFRVLTVVDKWSRESVLLEADFALSGQRVADALRPSAPSMMPIVSLGVETSQDGRISPKHLALMLLKAVRHPLYTRVGAHLCSKSGVKIHVARLLVSQAQMTHLEIGKLRKLTRLNKAQRAKLRRGIKAGYL